MRFNTEATRLRRVYCDTELQFTTHKNLTLEKTTRAEDRVRHLAAIRGLVPGLLRRIQAAVIQAVTIYGAEIWWNGQKR